MRIQTLVLGIFLFLCPGFALAKPHTVTVRLSDGRLAIGQLLSALQVDTHLSPATIDALSRIGPTVDLRGIRGWMIVQGLDRALGDGFNLTITDDALIARFDPDKLPNDWDQTCDALGRFTAVAAPQATQLQNERFGLHLPRVVDPQKPLVVLIHGLEGDAGSCRDLATLLRVNGYQTAIFAYPTEQPIARNAALFTQHMTALQQAFPDLRIDLVTQSMGALLARDYIEGPDYTGGVQRLIMIAPPNGGSRWVPYSILLKLVVNAADWWQDPQWSPTWMITEGLGESIADLQPDSKFLTDLNSRPRRQGVGYTIIAGDRSPQLRYEARILEICGAIIPKSARQSWGLRQMENAIQSGAQQLQNHIGNDDGPVTLQSAALAGVSDFVPLTSDHVELYESVDGHLPAAWPIIQDRLAH